MKRLLTKFFTVLILLYAMPGNSQDITAFKFANIIDRYGIAVTSGNEPLYGVLQLRSKAVTFGRHSEEEALTKIIWSENIALKPSQQKIIILPLDIYISEIETPIAYFKTVNRGQEIREIPFKKFDFCFLTENGLDFEITEYKDSNFSRFDRSYIYCPAKFLPEKSEDFFFNHLAINLKQLEKLPEKDYRNIKDFTIAGGSVILIDDLAADQKPGKRAGEFLPLNFGKKNSVLPVPFVQALTGYTIDSEKLPLFRNFSYPYQAKLLEANLPVYQTYFAKGLITYFGFDISKTGHPEGFLKTAWFNRNDNSFDNRFLEVLVRKKKAELSAWDYLFSVLANPMVLVAMAVSLFNMVFFIKLVLKAKNLEKMPNQRSYLSPMWQVCIAILIFIIITHFILGSKGLRYSFFEREILFPDSGKKQIKNSLHIRAETPITTQLEWKQNVPDMISSMGMSLFSFDEYNLFYKTPNPTISLNTQDKKLIGASSWITENNFLHGDIILGKDGKISGKVTNNTLHTFSRAYLAIPKDYNGHFLNLSIEVINLPELAPGDTCDVKGLPACPLSDKISQAAVFDGLLRILTHGLRYWQGRLPGRNCYFIGETDNYFFQPYFPQASKPFENKKVVLQKIPFISQLEVNQADSYELEYGKPFPLPDIEIPKTEKKETTGDKKKTKLIWYQEDESSPRLSSSEILLINSSVIGYKEISLHDKIRTMYLTLNFRTYDLKEKNSGDLKIEILNPQTEKWELIYQENLKPKTEDIESLRSELNDFRFGKKDKDGKKRNKNDRKLNFSSMFKGEFNFDSMFKDNRKRHGKNKPYADIVVEIKDWSKYYQASYPQIYFKFTHKGSGEKLIIGDIKIHCSSK